MDEGALTYFLSKTPDERHQLAKDFEDVIRQYGRESTCERWMLRVMIRVRREYKQHGFLQRNPTIEKGERLLADALQGEG